jgi:two-component system cell cycle sensor histidine kinase/response regulator CckA
VHVRACAVREGAFPEGSCVVVEVSDTGRGMPPHVLERILRGDATSTKPGGTGLGTRIVYNAVRAHNGVFEGQSREGAGTTFRIKLPLTRSDSEDRTPSSNAA